MTAVKGASPSGGFSFLVWRPAYWLRRAPIL